MAGIFALGILFLIISAVAGAAENKAGKTKWDEYWSHNYMDSIDQRLIEMDAKTRYGYGGYDKWKVMKQMEKAGIQDPWNMCAVAIAKHCIEEYGLEYNWNDCTWKHLRPRNDLDRFLNEDTRPNGWDELATMTKEEAEEKYYFGQPVDVVVNRDLPQKRLDYWYYCERMTKEEVEREGLKNGWIKWWQL